MNAIKKIIKETDWIFLIFLVIFLNQSNFSLKFVGILFIYIARPNFKFDFKSRRIPGFYLYIIPLSLLNLILNIREYTLPYLVAFSMAALLWIFCFLAYHQLKLSIEKYGEKVINTLKVFSLLNLFVCIFQIIMMWKHLGKYPYDMSIPFPYGLSAGDNVFGLLLQNGYYNVMISSMLCVYFLYKRQLIFVLFSLVPIILVFANTGTIIFIFIFSLIFFSSIISLLLIKYRKTSKLQSFIYRLALHNNYYLVVPLLFIFIVIVSYIVSPDNIKYTVMSITSKIHQSINKGDKQKLIALQAETVKSEQSGNTDTSHVYKKIVLEREEISLDYLHKFKGKKLSFTETIQYVSSSPIAFLFGAGPVRFSSLTAQKMAGYDSSRIFMKILPHYSSKLYNENHGLIIKVRTEQPADYRSSINWPDSFYNQILGEYGFLGILLFLFFYVWFFIKRIKFLSYGFWLCVFMVPFALLSYMFEPLAMVIIFEYLMELDIYENKSLNKVPSL